MENGTPGRIRTYFLASKLLKLLSPKSLLATYCQTTCQLLLERREKVKKELSDPPRFFIGILHGLLLSNILWLLIAILFLWLTGCTSLATDLRREGFNITYRGFEHVPNGREFAREYEMKVKVHIVSGREKFKYEPYRSGKMIVAGYADSSENAIWVIGKMLPDGTIIINQAVLGHELNHVLNWQGGEVVNPDLLDMIGY